MPIPPLYPRSQRTLHAHRSNPSSGQPRDTKKKSRKKKIWSIVIVTGLIIMLLGGIGSVALFAYFSKDLPDPEKINDRSVAESTRIYARDGTTLLYEIHGDVRRTLIKLEDIPKPVVDATLAIEDKEFYSHKGISITGIIRSIFKDITRGDFSQGGSTITQQFVKNAVLTNEKKLTRKMKEVVLAYQMENKFSKDQILQLYFNEIPYGSNVYGIQAAAAYYFNKDARDLTLDEGALLAAMTQRPTYFSPYGNNTESLVARQKLVLDKMQEYGFATAEEVSAAKEIDTMEHIAPPRESIFAPHFAMYVKQYLTDKYGESVVERGGLKVITTLNPILQRFAEEAVAENVDKNQNQWGASNAALVSLDAVTGEILAMVGSRDYFNKDIDGNVNVALRVRNPGSSFKPFVYATAFSKGFTPDTILFDLITNFGPQGNGANYIPLDYDGGERGPLTMRKALQGSLNIPAVKTLYLAGIPKVIETAKKAGYSTLGEPDQYGLALALGGAGVTLLDHTAAFTVFAQEGMYRKPTSILKVLDHKGKILEQSSVQETQALDKNIANMMANVLSDNDARSYIFGSQSKLVVPGRTVGAKTGTTNDWRDGWTIGFSQKLVAGVWVGNNDNSEMGRGADGSYVAAPIWNSYMRKALAGAPNEPFTPYTPPKTDKPILSGNIEGQSAIPVDSVTGLAIPSSCIEDYPEAFIKQSQYREMHDILFYVDKENPQGPVPTDPGQDPQFARWEEPVQRWAQKQGYVSTKPEEGSCSLRTSENLPKITITAPTTDSAVTSSTPTFSAAITSPRSIALVEFLVDDVLVGSAKNGKTAAKVDLTDIQNGFHTLTVRATDDVKNISSSTRDFNLLVPAGS